MLWGREFKMVGPNTEKTLIPTVLREEQRTTRRLSSSDRSDLWGVYGEMSSVRGVGIVLI